MSGHANVSGPTETLWGILERQRAEDWNLASAMGRLAANHQKLKMESEAGNG